jgi:hypothetical protein
VGIPYVAALSLHPLSETHIVKLAMQAFLVEFRHIVLLRDEIWHARNLQSLMHGFADCRRPKEVASAVADYLKKSFTPSETAILVVNDAYLSVIDTRDVPESDLPPLWIDDPKPQVCRVAREGVEFYDKNVLDHEEPYLAIVERTKSQYSVPLRRPDRVVGVLMVGMSVLDGLTEHHCNSIRAAASHCAAAIASAKRFQQEQAVRQLATDLMARAIALLERQSPSNRALDKGTDDQPLAMLRQFQAFLREYHRLRTTAEEREVTRAPAVDLVAFVREYCSSEICAALLSQSRQLQIAFSSDAATLPVYADYVSLTTILHALVVNAVEASQDTSGGISIHCHIKTKVFRSRNVQFGFLCVHDSGPGILPEDQGKLFQVGYSTKKGHLDLGLALAQNTAAVLGGAVLLQPAFDHGATFCLNLPLAEQGAEA